ncbi:MAG: DUF2259 domain-containing protein [Symploca sp. SIO3E6]|nr:DUF2259 domain-containing protein [Caldora sp. SIO3E6]
MVVKKNFFIGTAFCLLALVASAFLLDAVGLATVFRTSRRMSGFSLDSKHYIYLESSRNQITEVPTAQIQIIDVANNSCVSNGCLKTEYDRSALNITNQAAEDDLLQKTVSLRQRLRLNRLKVGRNLPILVRSISSRNSDTVQVRLTEQTPPLQIQLQQRALPSNLSGGTSDVDRTSMRLVVDYQYRRLTIGKLNDYRDAVKKYAIREVRLSPNERNLVVLIDMTQPTYTGVLQTTLVQSFPIWQ